LEACTSNYSDLSLEGEWAYANHRLRWVSPSRRCITPRLTSESAATCLDRIESLHIIGDSHLRGFTKYLLQAADLAPVDNGTPQWGHFDTVINSNLAYHWSTTSKRLSKRLEEVYPYWTASKLNASNVLIMNSGAWDLFSADMTTVVQTWVPDLINSLTELR
jgi:hypothetical protein